MCTTVINDHQVFQESEIADVYTAQRFFAELGIDTLPISYGKKAPPLISGWPTVSSTEAWSSVSNATNIAIRCGGDKNIAVIDCDETETFDIVYDVLYCAGVSITEVPIVQTASGFGRHIYVSVIDTPEGNYQLLDPPIGSGEFRYGKGAYCIAPPSTISGGGGYKLIQGDFNKIPQVKYSQIEKLLKSTETSLGEVRLVIPSKKKPSADAERLLRGEIPSKYPSRSEAECGLMLSLINSGFSREEIYDCFQGYPCAGKFREKYDQNPKAGDKYFEETYQNALEYGNNNDSQGRQIANSAIKWALNRPWPGRAGITDRDVFLAHSEIARRSGKIVYRASSRELAEIANVGYVTAANSTKRLVEQGFIDFVEPAYGKYPAQYRLNKSRTVPQKGVMRECLGYVEHDSFAYYGLGKSSRQILDMLQNGPKTLKELEEQTGRHINTIRNRLRQMERIYVDPCTGEIVRLVRKIGDLWYLCEQHDLDEIARHLGTSGRMERRRQDHIEQRRLHNRGLELVKRKDREEDVPSE